MKNTILWSGSGPRWTGLAMFMVGLMLFPPLLWSADPVVPPDSRSATTSAGLAAWPLLSADGRFVVFTSESRDLVADDGNGTTDVYLRDRQAGTTTLISREHAGTAAGNGPSFAPDMSADGRYIVFQSAATNLVGGGIMPPSSNHLRTLIYRLDRNTGEQRLINVQGEMSTHNALIGSRVHHLTNIAHDLIAPRLNNDGSRVLYESGRATHPVNIDWYIRGEDAWFFEQGSRPLDALFVWEASTGDSEYIGLSLTNELGYSIIDPNSGAQFARSSAMSEDGGIVATDYQVFAISNAWTGQLSMMNVVVRDRANEKVLIPAHWNESGSLTNYYTMVQGLSASGEWLLYSRSGYLYGGGTGSSTNNSQLWLFNVFNPSTTCITTNSALGEIGSGLSDSGTISADGNWIAYFSSSSNLVSGDLDTTMDVFLYDRVAGTTQLISTQPEWQGNLGERSDAPPKLTPDGRYLLYQAVGSGLFRYDRVAGTNALITTDVEGDEADISNDGRFVAFTAKPSSIDPSDLNPYRNVYVHDFETGLKELVSVRDPAVSLATAMAGAAFEPRAVSFDGRFIAFTSTLLGVDERANGQPLLWVRDTQLGTNILVSVDLNGDPLADGQAHREVQMTADGRWVCFVSASSDLVALDTNNQEDVFVRDLTSGITRLVSRSHLSANSASGRSFAPALARDSSVVVFKSSATDIASIGSQNDLYLHDLTANENRLATTNISGAGGLIADALGHRFSEDGRVLVFGNARLSDIVTTPSISGGQPVLLDLVDGSRAWIGGDSGGAALAGPVTAPTLFPGGDGSRILIDDRHNIGGVNTRLIAYDRGLGYGALVLTNFVRWTGSFEDGVAFTRTNSVTGQPAQLRRRDFASGVESVISLGPDGVTTADEHVYPVEVSPGGRYILFRTTAGNLALKDDNQSFDLFLHDTVLNVNLLLSRSAVTGKAADGNTTKAVFTRDGSKVIFESFASDLVAGDANSDRDIFVATLASADSDNDTLPDDWEMAFFGDLDQDADTDFDLDGLKETAELAAGTSPINLSSVLRAIAVTSIGEGSTRVLWNSIPGRRYQVKYRDGFEMAGWLDLGGELIAGGTNSEVVDSIPLSSDQRFYRVQLVE